MDSIRLIVSRTTEFSATDPSFWECNRPNNINLFRLALPRLTASRMRSSASLFSWVCTLISGLSRDSTSGVAGNNHEQAVHVVGHSGRQFSDGLEFLGVGQPLLVLAPFLGGLRLCSVMFTLIVP